MGLLCSSNAHASRTGALGIAGATLALVAAYVALTDDKGSSAVPFAILGVGTALALGSSSCDGCWLTRLFKRRSTTPERAGADHAAPAGPVPDADNPYARS